MIESSEKGGKMIHDHRARYQWQDENEKDAVERSLILQSLLSNKENFENRIKGKDIKFESATNPRYIVWVHPVGVMFDPSGEDGVHGPLEAIQWALDLHLDGGWDWLVWDRVQNIGFHVEPNGYIYAPLEAWAEERHGVTSFSQKSTQDLRKIVDAAQAVLRDRESRGTL